MERLLVSVMAWAFVLAAFGLAGVILVGLARDYLPSF